MGSRIIKLQRGRRPSIGTCRADRLSIAMFFGNRQCCVLNHKNEQHQTLLPPTRYLYHRIPSHQHSSQLSQASLRPPTTPLQCTIHSKRTKQGAPQLPASYMCVALHHHVPHALPRRRSKVRHCRYCRRFKREPIVTIALPPPYSALYLAPSRERGCLEIHTVG